MKFIKTEHNIYIRTDQIIGAQVTEMPDKRFVAYTKLVTGELLQMKSFACDPKSTTQFDPKAEAQAWLDKFVSEINGEDRTDRAKLIEVAARVRSIAEDVRMSENSNDNYSYYCQLCDAADDIEIIADED